MITEKPPDPGLTRLVPLLPLLLTAIIYLSTAGGRAVIDYDEGYYSQAALYMARSGDWVTPRANGVRFLEKPPLMYWLTGASFRLLGFNEFALRLPTAIGVIAVVWLVMRIARRAAGERAAIIAGFCISGSAGTYLFTRETLHDIWLVLFITLAVYALFEWYLDPLRSLGPALLFYAAMAGGVMTKSLVGIAFPAGIAVAFFLLMRERPKWRTLHLLPGGLLFMMLALPWHWLAALRNPAFLYSFFVNEQFLRFLGRHDPPVLWSLPILAFWALILVWIFPWVFFLPAALAAGRRPADPDQRMLVMLILAWLAVILGFYSISGRLEHYSFPVLPAFALLIGMALGRTDDSPSVRWGFRGLAILGVFILAAAAGVGIWRWATGREFQAVSGGRSAIVQETDFSILADMPEPIVRNLIKPAAVTIAAFAVGFPMAFWFEKRRRRIRAVMSVAAVMTIVCGMIHWSLVICEDLISSKKFALAVAQQARPGDHLVVVGDYESANSLNFYQPLQVEVFQGVAYALIPGMKYQDAPRIVLARPEFDAIWYSQSRVFALMPKSQAGDLKLSGVRMLEVLDRVLICNH